MIPSGTSSSTPPGRTNSLFILRPEILSKIRRMSSRVRNAMVIIVVAPSSLSDEPTATRWEAMRWSSMRSTLMTLALRGTCSSIPSSFSTAMQ